MCNKHYISELHISNIIAKVRFSNLTKYPSQVMMFGLVSSGGRKMNPIFLDTGLRLDTELYIEQVLVPHMLPLILKNNPYPEEFFFMQYGAPCNTSKKTQKWLEEQINF